MKHTHLWLRGMHIALGLMTSLLLVSLLSCQRAKEEKAELGPEASAESVDKAIYEAVKGRSVHTLALNQFATYSITQRVENQESTMNLGGYTAWVASATDSDDKSQTKFILKVTRTERQKDGSFKSDTSEEPPIYVPKPKTAFSATALKKQVSLSSLRAAGLALRPTATEPKKITYHNLRTATGTEKVPGGVASKPGCGGVPSCEMPLNYVRFSIVVWYSDTDYDAIAIDFAFSSATPYLPIGEDYFEQLTGAMVTDCRSMSIPVENRKVYVRVCKQLEDFQN